MAVSAEKIRGFPLHKPVKESATICPYCSCGCGLLIATDDHGHIVNSEGDPDHIINRGALDPKSIAVRQLSNSPNRLSKVLYRAPGSDRWEVKTWDWAAAEIAQRIRKTREASFVKTLTVGGAEVAVNRTEGLAWLGGAANNSEDCYIATKFSRSLGIVYHEHQARLCHSSTVAGLAPSFGRGAMTNDWNDLKNTDCVLVIGGNPAENHPASMAWINKARDTRGAKLVVVDPRISRTAAVSDCYAPLRPGTDIAFLGGLMRYILENRLYQEEYVKAYTNALTRVHPDFKGPADLDGVFSGFDAGRGTYDPATWQYRTEKVRVPGPDGKETEATVVSRAAGLDEPDTVFAHLRRHYARYTPEMIERVCGTPKDKFLEVARLVAATGKPDKSGTILYAMGQTQHSVGAQNIRAMAMVQLLLGNIGVPGGGVNALRGESNVQGSTDMAVLYHILPGYLGLPSDKNPDLASYNARYDTTSFWVNGPRFFTCLMKAWYGAAATKENEFAYDYLPKTSGDTSWIPLFEAIHAGKIKGLLCMGQNPAVSGPNSRRERKGMESLEWLVVMDLFETETATFWRAPGVDPKSVKTEVFLLPAADAMEKAGSVVTSGRRMQWRPKVAAAPGEAKEDIAIIDLLLRQIKALYKDSTDPKDRPIQNLVWDYGTPPDVERVAREINGFALDDVKDKDGKVLVEKGRMIPMFSSIAAAANPEAIACGCWIHSGYVVPLDDGEGHVLPASKRRGAKDPGGMGMYPYWGWTWPANRHILYNRASARPDGTPWAEEKKLLWWDPEKKVWTGYDVPDFLPTKAPGSKADPLGKGLAAQGGDDPFIMKADGKGWLFAPKGMNEGPLPEHYEPVESPARNLLSGRQANPMAKVSRVDSDKDLGNRLGASDRFPIVCTTFRLTEHWQSGTMSRHLPWLAEAQPDLFIEMSRELAAEKGIRKGDRVQVSTIRGTIHAVAVVTGRWKPYVIDGRAVHVVGLPWHYGWQGIATGDVVNDLTHHVGDANTNIPEYKAFLVDVRKA
jgi:formate dehydrogenase major subunit